MSQAKILIVDDEEILCDLLFDTLKNDGYITEKVYDGLSAIEKFDTNDFDVIILDLFIPKRTGMEVLKHIFDSKRITKVIMATGYTEIQTAVEALKMGAFDFLLKPFDLKNLKIIVSRAVEKNIQEKANAVLSNTFVEINQNERPAKENGNPPPIDNSSTEKQKILSVLQKTNWNKTRSAELLAMPLKILYSKIRDYGLKQ